MKLKIANLFTYLLRKLEKEKKLQDTIPFKPNLSIQLWLLNNYTFKELKRIASHTFGCSYGKCIGKDDQRCNFDCGANEIRYLLEHVLVANSVDK